ncbi:MAG TPA: hypothetical protein PLY34_20130 [Ferruginibacter sp.]|nr:hypothetical protein [Ferruginibacter sp.]HPH91792.1 hypothetical protein [Ferruginibacter sp.]
MRLINFLFLYVLMPVIIVWITIRSGSGYGFFALAFYAAGVVISQFQQWIFLPIPIIFTIWYWYAYGLGPTDYVFGFLVSLLAGVGLSEASKQYKKFMYKVLPEQMDNVEYNEKVDELNRRIDIFRKEHPNEKVTPEIVEKIRTEVFF